ncbi:MAG: hypothetical protein HY562_12405 [Ignavibacteriales bacterium]|nr:hypothetical protein [Ignavibacteriales bacterium]
METTNITVDALTNDVAEKPTVRAKVRIHKYTGKENHMISLVEASILTRTYRESEERGAVKGNFFGRYIFERILAQDGCVGIRSYFAAYDDGSPTLVHVGIDENGNDMIYGVLGDGGFPCPPFCGQDNILNADLGDRLIPVRKNNDMFSGLENHGITIAEAKNDVSNHRKEKDSNAIKGIYFSRDLYKKILAQDGCVGIRFYYAEEGELPTFVLVGADSKGNDLLGITGDGGFPCPPFCGGDSAL